MKKLFFLYLIFTQLCAIENKNYTVMCYMTSNNDLFAFSEKNIDQMKKIGSNNNLNILVQQDVFEKTESKRIFVKKNKLEIIQTLTEKPESISGTPENLFSFVKWCIENYPAKKYFLILWDHGSGIIDPNIWKFNHANLYIFNAELGLFELNRDEINKRGICFNEVFDVYLNNQDLKNTLRKISIELLAGKKITLGFDACNMAMAEIAYQIKDYVDIIIASQETEPGSGWNYETLLKPLKSNNLTPQEFAKSAVESYQKNYEKTFADFTLSAVNTTEFDLLTKKINSIAQDLITILNSENKKIFLSELTKIRTSRKYSTIFANPDYIDLNNFFTSLSDFVKKNINNEKYKINKKEFDNLNTNLIAATEILNKLVLKKTFCFSLPFADGISIYFPTKKIHNSYEKTDFATTNKWLDFLKTYTKLR